MLLTPLGEIKLLVNGLEVEYEAIEIEKDRLCQEVDGRYMILFEVKSENNMKEITCCIPGLDSKGYTESGEMLEAIAFYKDDIKLTIGVVGEFNYPFYQQDYNGIYLDNGIQYILFPNFTSRTIKFGVCWIQPVTEDNDIQTHFGVDIGYLGETK